MEMTSNDDGSVTLTDGARSVLIKGGDPRESIDAAHALAGAWEAAAAGRASRAAAAALRESLGRVGTRLAEIEADLGATTEARALGRARVAIRRLGVESGHFSREAALAVLDGMIAEAAPPGRPG